MWAIISKSLAHKNVTRMGLHLCQYCDECDLAWNGNNANVTISILATHGANVFHSQIYIHFVHNVYTTHTYSSVHSQASPDIAHGDNCDIHYA